MPAMGSRRTYKELKLFFDLTLWDVRAILTVGAAIWGGFPLECRIPAGGRKEVDTPGAGEYHL
jgi:hypothetical protein